jgi:hypothetical protein
MINRIEKYIQPPPDVEKVETAICLEILLDTYYKALGELAPDEISRKECQRFETQAQDRQKELRRSFVLSPEIETAIESKVYKYLLLLRPPSLFLRSVIDTAISLTAYKMDIYKNFSRVDQDHQELLNHFFEDSVKEMNFLRKEMKIVSH